MPLGVSAIGSHGIEISILIFLMLFNKTIRMYYSLFVFRFYYKIIG